MDVIDAQTDLDAVRAALNTDRAAITMREAALEAEQLRRDEQAHEPLLQRCRDAKAALDALTAKVEDAKHPYYRAKTKFAGIAQELDMLRRERPAYYAGAEQMQAWAAEHAAKADEGQMAAREEIAAYSELEQLQNERRRAAEEFRDLTYSEQAARDELRLRRSRLDRMKKAPATGQAWDHTADSLVMTLTSEDFGHSGGADRLHVSMSAAGNDLIIGG